MEMSNPIMGKRQTRILTSGIKPKMVTSIGNPQRETAIYPYLVGITS